MRRIGQQRFDARGKLHRISMLHKVACDAVTDHLRCAAMRTADHWLAERHRFQVNQAETLATARQRKHFARGIARGQFLVAKPAQEVDMEADAVLLGQAFEPYTVRSEER